LLKNKDMQPEGSFKHFNMLSPHRRFEINDLMIFS